MDSNKIIKHLYISCKKEILFAEFFNHVVGVLSVFKGIMRNENENFIHISFDDSNVTFQKLILIFISISKEIGDNELTIYTDGDNNSEIENILSLNTIKDKSILVKELSEFLSHSPVIKDELDILSYLAHNDEYSARSSTREGALNELSDTKKAMLNLLEDAYETQDKMFIQSENLTKALAESQQFAKKAEEERENYMLLISSIGEGVVVLTPEGKVDIVNEKSLKLFGLTYEQIHCKKVSETLEITDRKGVRMSEGLIKKVLTTNSIFTIPPLIVKRLDGTSFITSITVAPVLRRGEDKNEAIILTVREIGEEIALEDARINFISTASHQLRTPLTSMRWFSEMLFNEEAGSVSADQKQYLDQINQGINRMLNLVNYLLRTARVESNRAAILPIKINIKNYLMEESRKYEDYLKKKNQTIKIIGDDLPEIMLDPDYVNEVFVNIFKNANIYGKNGDEILVNIKLEGDVASVSITDHGIGIKDEDKPRVFEKFFRSEDAIIASPDGTGLGLAFVSMLVKEWDGEIIFESEVNVATTFTVTIPLKGMNERTGGVRLTE